jgi:4-hydroxybenzoate polyprenyltransferase
MSLKPLLITLRPKQWIKNLVIFAGLIFSQNLNHSVLLLKACAACALFCLLSSAVYLVNDLHDREYDRQHPAKKLRPVAAGTLPPRTAALAALIIGSCALAASFYLDLDFGLTASVYVALMLAYTFLLKRLVIIDAFVIAAGFVLRAVAGAAAIDVPISEWLLTCVILLSLFLALAKRRQELSLVEEHGAGTRPAIAGYTPLLLDQMISIVTAATVVCYSLYTLSADTAAKFGTGNLKYTIPFVLYGIFRYLYLIYKEQTTDNPEIVLLTDPWMLGNLLLYVVTVWFIIYQ